MSRRGFGDGYVTRKELAKGLGVSKSTIRRWEQAGKLTPIVDEHGVRHFPIEEARRLNGGAPIAPIAKARSYVASANRADGELAAKAFDLLAEGVAPVDSRAGQAQGLAASSRRSRRCPCAAVGSAHAARQRLSPSDPMAGFEPSTEARNDSWAE